MRLKASRGFHPAAHAPTREVVTGFRYDALGLAAADRSKRKPTAGLSWPNPDTCIRLYRRETVTKPTAWAV